MNDVALNPILERVFRSNPAYELVAFDRLPPDRQTLFSELASDPDFYGLLLPRASGASSIKSVCRETAQLVRTMVQSGPLPRYVLDKTKDNTNQAIAELVLDAVLELEHEGRFVSSRRGFYRASHRLLLNTVRRWRSTTQYGSPAACTSTIEFLSRLRGPAVCQRKKQFVSFSAFRPPTILGAFRETGAGSKVPLLTIPGSNGDPVLIALLTTSVATDINSTSVHSRKHCPPPFPRWQRCCRILLRTSSRSVEARRAFCGPTN